MVNKMSFQAQYVEGLSPAERGVYMSYWKRELEERKKKQTGPAAGPTIGSGIDITE